MNLNAINENSISQRNLITSDITVKINNDINSLIFAQLFNDNIREDTIEYGNNTEEFILNQGNSIEIDVNEHLLPEEENSLSPTFCPICYETYVNKTICITGCCKNKLCQQCNLKCFSTTKMCPFCRSKTGYDYILSIELSNDNENDHQDGTSENTSTNQENDEMLNNNRSINIRLTRNDDLITNLKCMSVWYMYFFFLLVFVSSMYTHQQQEKNNNEY